MSKGALLAARRIGILTGGGDVPGLNSVIKSVVYRGSEIGCEAIGIRRGWEGLTHVNLEEPASRKRYILPLNRGNTRTIDRTGKSGDDEAAVGCRLHAGKLTAGSTCERRRIVKEARRIRVCSPSKRGDRQPGEAVFVNPPRQAAERRPRRRKSGQGFRIRA